MPLYSGGLCDAVTITPVVNPIARVHNASAGVGRTPRSTTLTPVDTRPEAKASLTLSTLSCVCCYTDRVSGSQRASESPAHVVAQCDAEISAYAPADSARAKKTPFSHVHPYPRGYPTTWRRWPCVFLPLGELRRLTGTPQPVFLAFLDPRVSGEKTVFP